MTDRSIKKKAASSLIWSSVEQFGSQGLSLIITIVIARIVAPSDYGLIAMLSIFMALSQVFINSGFSFYLIQNKERTAVDYSTVFYMNVAIGITCYLILVLCAPMIADLYSQPVLEDIIKYYCLVLVITSLTLVQRAILYIEFKYKKLSVITITSLIIAGVSALVFAVRGYGVWTLVYYHLIQAGVSSVLMWISSSWHPSLAFSKGIASKAFRFGSKLLGANLLSNGVSHLYTLVIGIKFQAAELGYYSRGQSLAMVFPSNFSHMLQQASYPVFCELQDDKEELRRVFFRYVSIASFVCFPIMMVLLGISEPLIRVILTDKWMPAVPFLQIMAVGYTLDPIMRLNSIILSVTGKTQLSLYSEILKKGILLGLLFATLPFGILWVTYGMIIYSVCDLIVVSFFVKRIISFSLWKEIKAMLPFAAMSLCPLMLIYAINLTDISDMLKLCVSIPLSAAAYLALVRVFMRRDFDAIISQVKQLAKRRNG